ncbi:MAG: PD40 domain-containing protein [Deltaproteobacteria bacterium]|nr:PD40 domain-containing protein [Deltaproteobacteria bacterium]
MIQRLLKNLSLITIICAFFGCASGVISNHRPLESDIFLIQEINNKEEAEKLIQKVISNFDRNLNYPKLKITNPFNQSIFPLDIASPTFSWRDGNPYSDTWLIKISFEGNGSSIYVVTGSNEWTPDKNTWEIIKFNSINSCATLTILGIADKSGGEITSRRTVTFSTSQDKVGAPIVYEQMLLPFAHAQRNSKKMRWLMGDVSSYEKPRIILMDLPACAKCHSFSTDGSTFGMDVDYKRDKGAYMLAPVRKKMIISKEDVITWNDLPPLSDKIPNMGLFSKISPRGRYVMTTVNEKPFMAIMDDLYFSQLFFPITGKLAYYSRGEKKFHLLPGADSPDYVQTSPAWSPDGKTIIFSRARVNERLSDVMGENRLLDVDPKVTIDELNRKYQIQFDIYRVPFNNGRGGAPEPLDGASGNGKSNYFPRFSPDGRWIVFNQSETGMVAQPSSLLYIVPAAGGVARKMTCNTALFNSWHSWSPSGKWLVFTSKVNTPYTELFLTHIDEAGNDSPPVLLSRFKSANYAAVIPEFVNVRPGKIEYMVFLD